MLFSVTACGGTEDTETVGTVESMTEQSATEEESDLIEQPIVTVENFEKGVKVTWNEIPGAEGYYVYSKIKGDKYKKIATITEANTVQYIDYEALSGTSYYYAVRAFVGEEKSGYEAVNIVTGIWEPEIEVSYDNSVMNITWNQISGADGYIVYRKEVGGEYSRLSIIEDTSIITYSDEEVVAGKIYVYAVRAYKANEKSTYTSVTKGAIGQPLVEVKEASEGAEVRWNKIEEAEGYYVYRKQIGGKYEILQKIEDNEITNYLDLEWSIDSEYIYAVRAYIGEYKSSYLEVDIDTSLDRVKVSLEALKNGVQVEWNKVPTAEGYYVYKKTEGEEEYSLVNTITDVSITEYLDQQIESGKTYYYAVRAFVEDMQSSYSGGTITTK